MVVRDGDPVVVRFSSVTFDCVVQFVFPVGAMLLVLTEVPGNCDVVGTLVSGVEEATV